MHSIPNCCQNTNQNHHGKSKSTRQTGHPHKSTNNKRRKELPSEVTPPHVQWKWTLTTATRKHSLRMSKKKKPRKTANPRIRHPHTWANILRKSSFNKNTRISTFTAVLLKTAQTELAKCPLTD